MSTPRKKRTAKEIFNAAVEYYEPRQWEGYIVDACGEDEALRQRVRELLEAHRQSDSLLDGNAERTDAHAISERPGTLIGPYKLLQEIGEGGFGVVYMAEQLEPVRRKVAMKIIKPGMDTKQVIARFEAERQALAMMDHPNIAKVLDAGATESGRPYFVMELVNGIPITAYCDRCKLSTEDRLKLFVVVCRAVQHAHLKAIIHRDIKPTNILVTQIDGQPVPKVIDFGVAKATNHRLTERSIYTQFSQIVGTPLNPDLGSVAGVVTLNGQPLPGARGEFQPESGDRGSAGVTDKNGRYTLEFTLRRQGAKIGRHVGRISTFNEMLNDKNSFEIRPGTPELVPLCYNFDTQLAAKVDAGRNTINWDLNSVGDVARVQPVSFDGL